MTVSQLLTQSRTAHLAKKQAAGRSSPQGIVTQQPNYPLAESHIREALRLREEAHRLDPQMTDAAWADDLAANKGVTSDALVDWFRSYLETP